MENTGLTTLTPFLSLSLLENKESLAYAKFITCPACNGIVWETIYAKCGNVFCETCFNVYTKLKFKCPKHPDILLEKKNFNEKDSILQQIFDLIIIKCKNYNEGCDKILPYNDLKNHLDNECKFQEVFCPNNCSSLIMKKDLNEHLKNCSYRKIKCEECGEFYIIKDKEIHKNNCPKSSIKCDNGCGKIISRDQLEKHKRDECPKTKISCQFCGINFERDSMRKHNIEYEEKHYSIFNKKFNELNESYNKMNKKIDELNNCIKKFAIPNMKLDEFETRISQNEQKLKDNKKFFNICNELNVKLNLLANQVEQIKNKKENNPKEESIIINDDKNQFLKNKRTRKISDSKKNLNLNIETISNKNNKEINKNNNNNIKSPKSNHNNNTTNHLNNINNIHNINNNNTLNLIGNENNSKKPSSISSDSSSITLEKNIPNKTLKSNNSYSEKRQNNELENEIINNNINIISDNPINNNNNNNINNNNNNNNNMIQNQKDLFDKLYIGPSLKVFQQTIMCEKKTMDNKHEFAFGGFYLDNNTNTYHFIYKINLATTNLPWLAVGLCDKDFVIDNNYKFRSKENGFFGISTNGKIWNNNNKNEFCKSFWDGNVDKNEIQVTFDYFPNDKILRFDYNNLCDGTLHDVYAKKSAWLTFCIVFYNSGDYVELIYSGIS